MAIDFPSSPTNGQTFTSGKVVYTYNSALGVWKPALLGTALPFNKIVNPSMQVSQENASNAVTTSGAYVADNWIAVNSTAMTMSAQRVASITPRGSPYRFRYTNTSAGTPAAGTNANIQHPIEGTRIAELQWGTASAQQIVIRFGFRGPAGTYSMVVRNATPDRSYVSNFTITSGQANTDTEQIFVIPGDTTGTWIKDASGRGMTFTIQLGTNVTPAATNNTWTAGNAQMTAANTNVFAVANSVFEAFDFGLYADPNKTGRAPAWDYLSDRQAIFDCQRYWQKDFGALGIALAQTNTPARASYPNQAQMRIAPSMAGGFVGSMQFWDQATSPALTNIATSYANKYYFEADYTCASAQTAGRASMLIGTSQSVYIAHNARM